MGTILGGQVIQIIFHHIRISTWQVGHYDNDPAVTGLISKQKIIVSYRNIYIRAYISCM